MVTRALQDIAVDSVLSSEDSQLHRLQIKASGLLQNIVFEIIINDSLG